jgi:hypothetical protein
MRFFTYLIFMGLGLHTAVVFAQQKGDYQWIMGVPNSPTLHGTLMDFTSGQLILKPVLKNNFFYAVNASICDRNGHLLLYSNGCDMFNGNHRKVINNTVIPQGYYQELCPAGLPSIQGGLLLPQPDNDTMYYYFHIELDEVYPDTTGTSELFPLAPLHLYYMEIRYPPGASNGRVTKKRQVAVADTLARCGMKPVRHANGRDWWLLMPEAHSNCYYRVLITPQGVQNKGRTCVGFAWGDADGTGQSSFSEQGDVYLRSAPYDGKVFIYPFDRCTGDLSQPVMLTPFEDSLYIAGGICTSPSGRFLYVTNDTHLWQYDLQASDISGSRILLAATDSWVDEANFEDSFWMMQLGPDGKIYVGGTANFKYLHVIHQPDSAGVASQTERHAIKMFTYNHIGMPTFPNFRLGALKGSACDTLLLSSAGDAGVQRGPVFSASPNPAQDRISIRASGLDGSVQWQLRDVRGLLWRTGTLHGSVLELPLEGMPPGMYYWIAQDARGVRRVLKWAKVTP